MNVIPLQQIIAMWDQDAEIDQLDPKGELLKIPILHKKYSTQVVVHSMQLKNKEDEYSNLKKVKYEYYTTKLNGTQELKDRGWPPFQHIIMKTDLQIYYDADKDLQPLRKMMYAHQEAINYCNGILKELNSRTYQIRGYMEHLRFEAGER